MGLQRLGGRTAAGVMAIAAMLAVEPGRAATLNSYIGPDQGLWTTNAYWSLGVYPSFAPVLDILINASSQTTVQLTSTSPTINNLTIGNLSGLSILSSFQLNGGFIDNSGTISLGSVIFRINADTTLTGTGTFLLNGTWATFSSTSGTSRLTNNSVISGFGNLANGGIALTNNGTISATSAHLYIAPSAATINTGVLRADGGSLTLSTFGSEVLTNTGGIIEAVNNSLLTLDSSFFPWVVTGGTVRGLSGGTISMGRSVLRSLTLAGNIFAGASKSGVSVANLLNCTTSANISIPAAGYLQVSQTLNNSGVITVNGTLFASSTFLVGSGSIVLSSGLLTSSTGIDSSSRILGSGTLGIAPGSSTPFAFTNYGTVSATTGTLVLKPSNNSLGFYSAGTLRADGGTLLLQSVLNNGGKLEAMNGSLVMGATSNGAIIQAIIGGTLSAKTGGTITLQSVQDAILDMSDPTGRFTFFNGAGTSQSWLSNVTISGNGLLAGVSTTGTSVKGLSVSGSLTVDSINLVSGTITGAGKISGVMVLGSSSPLISNVSLSGDIVLASTATGAITNNKTLVANGTIGIVTRALPGEVANIINNGTIRSDGSNIIITGTVNNTNGVILLNNGAQSTFNGSLSGGTLDVRTNSKIIFETAAVKLNSLALSTATNGTMTATVNLKNNKFVLQSNPAIGGDKASKLLLLRTALASGFYNGDWLGTGITSSTVAVDQSATGSHLTSLALYDNAILNLSSFGGQSVNTSSLLITTALIGDANFDNIVNTSDFNIVVSHWQTAQNGWTRGDLNYDGFVDILDAVLVSQHWLQTYNPNAPSGAIAAEFSVLTVPEPGALLSLLAALPLMLRRSARHRR